MFHSHYGKIWAYGNQNSGQKLINFNTNKPERMRIALTSQQTLEMNAISIIPCLQILFHVIESCHQHIGSHKVHCPTNVVFRLHEGKWLVTKHKKKPTQVRSVDLGVQNPWKWPGLQIWQQFCTFRHWNGCKWRHHAENWQYGSSSSSKCIFRTLVFYNFNMWENGRICKIQIF